jgi:carboxyl-terminal processing protease
MRKVVTALVFLVLLAPGAGLAQTKSGKGGVYEQLNLFSEAFERIRQDAVEPVPDTKLIETAITGMLSSLDPNCVYLSESAYKNLQNPAAGDKPASIGLVATIENGQLKVVSPRDGSPAAEAGIKPGDIIYAIDKEPTYDLTLTDVEQKFAGLAGSEIALTLRRDGSSTPIDVKIKRAATKLQTVSGRVESGNIGYLRIAGFDETTQATLVTAVQDIQQKAGSKLIGFVVDLRNNPGGSFDAAVALADAFIDKGDIAVVKGRKSDDVKRISATPGDLANGLPIVALVNGGTAREAELVAGALQDNRRAVLLGTKTYGQSAIESIIPLHGNGAIRLTTARFVTPSGRAIQGKGLDPDLTVVPLKLEKIAQADRRREADLRGALKNPDDATAKPPTGSRRGSEDYPGPGAAPASPPAGSPPGATATPAPSEPASVATGDIGTVNDEQLTQALDVLRGLSLVSARNTR